MNRILRVAVLALVAGSLGSFAGCHPSSSADGRQAGSSTAAADSPMRVTAARPVRKTLRSESVQPGQIEPFEQTPLYGKLAAYVEKLYVDIGDRVEADQLLADLFLPELKDELHQKEAALAQAVAEIDLATAEIQAAQAAVATAQANLSATDAGILRADADVVRWQSQFARISQLVSGGSVERKLEDETRDSLKAAEAAGGEAHAKQQSAKAMLLQSQADLSKAKAAEAVARARQKNAEADLSRQKALAQYTQIKAPYAGVVIERNVNRGDFVQPGGTTTAKPLLAVARTDIVRIFVDVPEMDSPWVEAGHGGYVNVQALPDRIFEGKVTRTSWALGANRTLRTELDLPNPNGSLRPGMYATAHVLLQERSDACVLPITAVVRSGKDAYCWIAKGGQATRVPITLGLQVGTDIEVVSGLKGDESVVQSPAASLQEGRALDVAPPEIK